MIRRWRIEISVFLIFLILISLTLFPISWFQIKQVASTNVSSHQSELEFSRITDDLVFYLPLDKLSQDRTNKYILDRKIGLLGYVEGAALDIGLLNSGIRFMEESGRIGFEDHSVFDFVANNDFTFNLWIKLDSIDENNPVVLLSQSEGESSNRKWMFTLSRAGAEDLISLSFLYWSERVTQQITLGSEKSLPFHFKSWQFISFVKNAFNLRFYINGTFLGTARWFNEIDLPLSEMSIGNLNPSDGNIVAVDGVIDEISIYNENILQTDILNIYQQNLDIFIAARNDKTGYSIDTPPLFIGMLVSISIVIIFSTMLFNSRKK